MGNTLTKEELSDYLSWQLSSFLIWRYKLGEKMGCDPRSIFSNDDLMMIFITHEGHNLHIEYFNEE